MIFARQFLSPSRGCSRAWLLGSILFMLPIILVQSIWMEMFLEIVSGGLRVRLTRPMSAAVSIPGTTHYHTPISCAYRADN